MPDQQTGNQQPDLPDDPCAWLILYEDADRPHETFTGCGATEAAHLRFAAVKRNWNCHLFVRVARG